MSSRNRRNGISLDRRRLLGIMALAPALPALLSRTALARDARDESDRVLIVVRMMGGNDGLNAVVPVRDDRYYKLRPTIALRPHDTILLPGSDRALNRYLAAYHDLMQEGHAGLLQGVGYPKPSRSHLRATEIWETGSLDQNTPAAGWLGRWFDAGCACDKNAVAGLQFGDTWGRTLNSDSARARLIGDPELLLQTRFDSARSASDIGNTALQQVLATQAKLQDAALELRRVRRSSGKRFAYPETVFGNSLRWTADLIEAHAGPRAYYLTLGSFETGAASFDTHIDQVPKHAELYSQLGTGLRALTQQLRRSGDLDRTLLVTFSDFGRAVAENRTRGTEHGDAGLLFYAGGGVRAGLQGRPADLGKVTDGGLDYSTDFRRVYAEVLQQWLGGRAEAVLGAAFEPAGILA